MKHENMPKRCRKNQVDYLQCRMKNGLMENEDLTKLGLGPEVCIFRSNLQTSWETEEQEKKYLYEKINKLKDRAWQEALRKQQERVDG